MSETTVTDSVTTALVASRSARLELDGAASALGHVEGPPEVRELERLVLQAVGALSFSEDAGAPEVSRALETAADLLRQALSGLQSIAGSDANGLAVPIELLARTMASLYPVRRGLERALASGAGDAAMPHAIPLSRKRSSKPVLEVVPDKPVLEVVPDDDGLPPAISTPPPRRDPTEPVLLTRERRGTRRVELEVDIGYHSETNFFTGFVNDISEGGIFVATYDLLPVGTHLMVSFVLPDGTPGNGARQGDLDREPRPSTTASCSPAWAWPSKRSDSEGPVSHQPLQSSPRPPLPRRH